MIQILRTEKWARDEKVNCFNQEGGFANIKYHLMKSHNMTEKEYKAVMPLVIALSNRILYDAIQADIR